jgi:hypothetical protein
MEVKEIEKKKFTMQIFFQFYKRLTKLIIVELTLSINVFIENNYHFLMGYLNFIVYSVRQC